MKVSDNGWITATLFTEWALSFVKSLPKDDTRPDGHSSHIYNLPFIELMKANNIHPFAFPPHCTHCLQPADKSLFKSIKHHWNEDGWQLTKASGGARLQKSKFFKLFSKVWSKSATIEIAQNGFRSTGLFPVNPGAIPESVFTPSLTSDRVLQSNGPTVPETSTEQQDTLLPEIPPTVALLQSSLAVEEQTSQQIDVGVSLTVPQSSQPVEEPSSQQIAQVDVGLSFTELTLNKAPAGLIPFGSLAVVPHRERRATNRKRISPPSYQLTSPEHIAFITSKKIQVTQQKKPDRSASKKTKATKTVSADRKKESRSTSSHNTDGKKSRRTAKNRSPKSNTNQMTAVSSSSVACPVCDVAEKSPEDIHLWIACHVCETWYHEPCAEQRGIFNDDKFKCQSCYNKPNK